MRLMTLEEGMALADEIYKRGGKWGEVAKAIPWGRKTTEFWKLTGHWGALANQETYEVRANYVKAHYLTDSIKEMAKALDVSEMTIRRIAKREGLTLLGPKHEAPQQKRYREIREKVLGYSERGNFNQLPMPMVVYNYLLVNDGYVRGAMALAKKNTPEELFDWLRDNGVPWEGITD